MSIKKKLMLLVVMCFLAMIGFAGGLVYLQQEKWIQKDAEWFAKDTCKDIAHSYSGASSQTNHEQEQSFLKTLATKKEILAVRIYRSPLVSIDFGDPKDPSRKPKDNFEMQAFSDTKAISRTITQGGRKVVEVAMPLFMEGNKGCENCHSPTPGQVLGGVKVTVPVDVFGQSIQKDRKDILLIAVAFTIFLLGFIMSLITRLVDKPITAIINAAQRIANGEISEVSLKAGEKDEVGKLAEVFSRMTKSLSEIASGAKVMASGNLSTRLNQSGELAESFNHMVDSLRNLVDKIHMSSATLGNALQNISQTAQEQTKGAEEQIEEVENLENTVRALSNDASDVADKSDKMLLIAKTSLKSTKIGRISAGESQKAMMAIRGMMDETTKKVMELKERTGHISKILEIINDVAMETKILSVNASIEASKAGEAGKGFSVVAEEIAKLAENVVQATATIKDVNEEIQSFSGVLTKTMDESRESVEYGVSTIKKVDKSLENMVTAATKTAAAAQKISILARGQNDKNRAVHTAMQLITQRTKELTTSAQRTNDQVDSIKEMFNNLQKYVSNFKTGNDGGTPEKQDKKPGIETPAQKTGKK